MKQTNGKLPLIIIFLSLSLTDAFLTLSGQPPCYWENHAFCNEDNIIFDWALHIGPLFFVTVWLLYSTAVGWVIYLLRRPWAVSVFVYTTYTHSVCSYIWLRYFVFESSWLVVPFTLIMTALFIWSIGSQAAFYIAERNSLQLK